MIEKVPSAKAQHIARERPQRRASPHTAILDRATQPPTIPDNIAAHKSNDTAPDDIVAYINTQLPTTTAPHSKNARISSPTTQRPAPVRPPQYLVGAPIEDLSERIRLPIGGRRQRSRLQKLCDAVDSDATALHRLCKSHLLADVLSGGGVGMWGLHNDVPHGLATLSMQAGHTHTRSYTDKAQNSRTTLNNIDQIPGHGGFEPIGPYLVNGSQITTRFSKQGHDIRETQPCGDVNRRCTRLRGHRKASGTVTPRSTLTLKTQFDDTTTTHPRKPPTHLIHDVHVCVVGQQHLHDVGTVRHCRTVQR